jgi:hypothetical protein
MGHNDTRPKITAQGNPVAPEAASPSDEDVERFREALRAFVTASCAKLSGVIPPTREWKHFRRTGENTYTYDSQTRLSSDFFVRFEIDDDAFTALAEVVRLSPGLTSYFAVNALAGVETEEPGLTQWIWRRVDSILNTFMRQAFSDTGSFNFDVTTFDAMFEKLASELRAPVLLRRAIVSIPGLRISGTIDFGDGVKIRNATGDEIDDFFNAVGGESADAMIRQYQVSETNVVLDIQKGGARSFDLISNVDAITDRVMVVLNLVLGALIVPSYQRQRIESICFGVGAVWPMAPYQPPVSRNISEQESAEIKAMWRRLERSPNHGKVATALRRMNFAAQRRSLADAFIDYTVALESMLSSDEHTEISFRLSLRLATLIGSTGDERRTIFSRMRFLYGLRSEVLHGSVDESALTADVEELQGYARRTILRLVMLRQGLDLPALERGLLEHGYGDRGS